MFELQVKANFSAAHHLRGYAGDCSRPHGHTWVMEFFVQSKDIDGVGMTVDFRVLKAAAREIAAVWDHRDLNELPEFSKTNPTAERIARLAFDRMAEALAAYASQSSLSRVRVWESEDTSATYFPG